jgi:hypothetical protein
MAIKMKINIDKVSVRPLFKAVVKAHIEKTKCRLLISPIAQASEFHMSYQFTYRIPVTTDHPDIRGLVRSRVGQHQGWTRTV